MEEVPVRRSERIHEKDFAYSRIWVVQANFRRAIGELRALEDAIHIAGCTPVLFDIICAVGDQAAGRDGSHAASTPQAACAGPQGRRSVCDELTPTRSPSRSGRDCLSVRRP